MRTTVEIPDALARQAREVAQRSGTTLRELILAGLRSELDRRERAVADFHFPVVSGHGRVSEPSLEGVLSRSYGLPS